MYYKICKTIDFDFFLFCCCYNSIRGTAFPLLIEALVLMLSWWIKYQNCNKKDRKTADILSLDSIYIKKVE